MTDAPRTRTRTRPHTTTDTGEQRVTGSRTAVTATTQHKPSATTQLLVAEPMEPLLVARVTVTDGVTLNMGDYSSFRRDIGLELDVPLGVAEGEDLTPEQQAKIDRAHDKAKAWVADRLADVVDEASEFFEGVR